MGGKDQELYLIKRAVSGEKEALEELLKRNYRIVKGYLLKTTCNYNLTEDLTQETMYRAIKNIKSYKPVGKFSTWLITIASNIYRDQLRKRGKEILHNDFTSDLQYNFDKLDLAFETKEKVLQLQNILVELPFEKKAVIILKHYYGYSCQEIALNQ